MISVDALTAYVGKSGPRAIKITKNHHYPRKVAAAELFSLNWATVNDPAEEVLRRFSDCYGQFNLVLPEENKRLVKYQKTQNFVSPADSYAKAGIELKPLSQQNYCIDGECGGWSWCESFGPALGFLSVAATKKCLISMGLRG